VGCERNWSVFEHASTFDFLSYYSFNIKKWIDLYSIVHCNSTDSHKEKNRLEHKILQDLVYVKYN